MPVKLIGTIILMVLVAVLTGFNLDNKCTFWFFHSFQQIPVFSMMLGSFVLGVLVTLPFTFGKRVKKDVEEKAKKAIKDKKGQGLYNKASQAAEQKNEGAANDVKAYTDSSAEKTPAETTDSQK